MKQNQLKFALLFIKRAIKILHPFMPFITEKYGL